MTPRTKEAIRERAKAAGLTVTDYLCYSGLGKEIVRVEGLEQVLSELKAQGRNLNQLTTLANMGRVTVLKGDALAENYGKLRSGRQSGKIYEQLQVGVLRGGDDEMATFTAIKNRGGGRGALGGVLRYVQQEEKTTWEDRRLVSGWNCTAQSVCSKCSSPRSGSIRQTADSTITSCSPLRRRMT